jgi:hypothetical protein
MLCLGTRRRRLQEAGYPELARSFREPGNPVAGMTLDVLLGKR